MELFKKEKENRDYLFDKVKNGLEIEWKDIFIGIEIPVPYKHIYIPVRNSLEIWCFKQDICIYKKLFDKSVDPKRISLNSNEKIIINVTIEKNASMEKDVGMPFVIVETKMISVKTEDILAVSEKTKMIKSIFPYCKAFLLIFGIPNSRVFRLCSGFDELLFIPDLGKKSCEHITKKLNDGFSIGYGSVPFTASYNYPYKP